MNLISIIIPTFNRANVLVNAVQSVLAQTHEEWELLVIDDGSDDNTQEVMQSFLEDTRIKYFYQSNQGVSAARNRGAELAGGDYLIFLDSDDQFRPNLIRRLIEANHYQRDVLCWEVVKIINGKKSISKPKKLGKIYNGVKANFLAGSICYRNEVFKAVGGYDSEINFGENYELGMRISHLSGLKWKVLHDPLSVYIINTRTRTSNSLDNRLKSTFHIYNKHIEKYEENRSAKSEMNYLLGHLLECSNKRDSALDYYKTSWHSAPWKPKPFLKIIHLSLFS